MLLKLVRVQLVLKLFQMTADVCARARVCVCVYVLIICIVLIFLVAKNKAILILRL